MKALMSFVLLSNKTKDEIFSVMIYMVNELQHVFPD